MPVSGQPPAPPAPGPAGAGGLDQKIATPTVPESYGAPLPERLRAVVLGAGSTAVEWTMVDRAGLAVDLTDLVRGSGLESSAVEVDELAGAPAVALRLAERLGGAACSVFAATVVDEAAGRVRAEVDPLALPGPGIYDGEFAALAADSDAVVFSNRCLVVVERSLFGGLGAAGPPSLAEIRLHLRDSSPGEQRLLDTVAYGDSEIAACVERPVLYWNEALPPVSSYTTADFPHRFHWLEAIKANLFWIAAEYYRRNHLAYQAAGVAVDDLDREQSYEQKAAALWEEYKAWVRQKKISDNVEGGWGVIGSPYGW